MLNLASLSTGTFLPMAVLSFLLSTEWAASLALSPPDTANPRCSSTSRTFPALPINPRFSKRRAQSWFCIVPVPSSQEVFHWLSLLPTPCPWPGFRVPSPALHSLTPAPYFQPLVSPFWSILKFPSSYQAVYLLFA